MIDFGGGMIFPDSYGGPGPYENEPDVVSCPGCGEDRYEGESCEHCGDGLDVDGDVARVACPGCGAMVPLVRMNRDEFGASCASCGDTRVEPF